MVAAMEENNKVIDIEKAIRNSNSKFFRSLPRFVVRFIIKIVRQDEINKVIYNNRQKNGVPFLNGLLHDWNVKVEVIGEENIPATGRFIFASNHPVGGVDALAIFNTIYRHFHDIISPANELLRTIPNVRTLIYGVNVFGKTTREKAVQLNEVYESDIQIMIFPAGEVSRRNKGVISDLTWQKSFISKAIEHRRDIIPVFIAGRNSNLFYMVANLRKFLGIKMYVETLLLPREMMKQRNSKVILYIGKPIQYQTLTEELTHSDWAQRVKEIVYSLPENL
jgi:putative hemolysin